MNVLGVLNSPWAIVPAKLLEIQGIYQTRMAGSPADLDAITAALGKPLSNQRAPYVVTDGVAEIQVQGVLAKRMNLFTEISGGTSTEILAQDIRAALADPSVKSILLAIDSPGGTVDGTQALRNLVLAARQEKPIVALAGGLMASAAYWIGSAADAVYIADGTTITGSVGVVTSHVDVSQAEAREGVKTTEVYAGKYKRIASGYAPLSEAGRQVLQDQVDYLYSVFVGDVARNRGVSVEAVLTGMADGRIFVGEQAITAGLADAMLSREQLLAKLSAAAKAKQ